MRLGQYRVLLLWNNGNGLYLSGIGNYFHEIPPWWWTEQQRRRYGADHFEVLDQEGVVVRRDPYGHDLTADYSGHS